MSTYSGSRALWLPSANHEIHLLRRSHVYKAFATTRFNGSCPRRGLTDVPYACNITTAPSYASTFTPSVPPDQTLAQGLVPHPLAALPEEPFYPPPSRDCTDMSLTYPDWTIEDGAIYVPSPSRALMNQTTLNFTITSRPTGVQQLCRWGGRDLELRYGDELMMACGPLPGAPYDASGTLFRVKFTTPNRELEVQQNWTCGSTRGDYKRGFQARTSRGFKMPLFCADDGGRVCRAKRHVIKGELMAPVVAFTPAAIPPPPGAMQPGCTAKSGIPTWLLHLRFEDTRYGRAPGNAATPSSWRLASRTLTLVLRNDANNYTQTCTIDPGDGSLAASAQTWLRCFPDTGLAQRYIETYLRWNQTSAELRVNQTWFCSDTDPSTPLLYQGAFTFKVPLCGKTNSSAPGEWPSCRDFYRTRWCETATNRNNKLAPQNRTVYGNILRTERLPANALTDPDPDPHPGDWACTADSLARPIEWRLRQPPGSAAVFSTAWPNAGVEPRSTFTIELNNSATARRPGGGVLPNVGATGAWLTPYFAGWRPATPYGVEETPNAIGYYQRRPYRNMVDWSFRFDALSRYLELNHTWFCNDKNPDMP